MTQPEESRQEEDDDLPLTKRDLRRILDELREIRGVWKPEVAAVREEVVTIRAQVTAVQATTSTVLSEHTHLLGQVAGLRSQVELLSRSVEMLETRHRRRNIRVRGIPDSVSSDELPAYVSRLALRMAGLPPDKPDVIGSVFRVRKPAALSKGTPRDVVVAFHDVAFKVKLMSAPGARDPVKFEGSTLALYHDLPFQTLLARRRFRPVIAVLRRRGIRYRWGLAGALVVTHNNVPYTITDPETAWFDLEAAGILPDPPELQPD
uniref:Uncharacterized protein n=1 Tax=Leptobrachium leishanense TaxID=445787 RepID=A0A8C5M5E3_9ANUR